MMKKNIIGRWGKTLDTVPYARAVAALGTLEAVASLRHRAANKPEDVRAALQQEIQNGEQTALWRGSHNAQGTTSVSWQETVHQNAAALAAGWDLLLSETAYHARLGPRLAVSSAWRRRSDIFDFDALHDLLAGRDVGLQALVLAPPGRASLAPRTVWHWPLQVGLPVGSTGENMLHELLVESGQGWLKQLSQPYLVGDTRDTCDLLILPPGTAAGLAQQPNLRLRASFIICLENPVAWSKAGDTPAAALLEKTGAAGIALVGNLEHRIRPWYREIVREISHDLPVHAAVWGVGVRLTEAPPTLIGYPDYLDRLRILAIAERFDRRRRLVQDYYTTGEPVSKGSLTNESMSRPDLAGFVRSSAFTSEEHYGLHIAGDFQHNAEISTKFRQPRWIQAEARHAGALSEPARTIAPDQPNLVHIYIGPTDKERSDQPFPDREFDFRDGPIPLAVQFELAGAAISPFKSTGLQGTITTAGYTAGLFQLLQRAQAAPEPLAEKRPLIWLASESISLPEFGSSTPATFVVWPQEGVSQVNGRIAIIHQNRVIQEARFEAAVTLEPESETTIVVEVDNVVHPRFDDLNERQLFDAALIAADDNERMRLTINKNGVGRLLSLDKVQAEIKSVRKIVMEVTRREEDALDINSDSMRTVLYSLAYQGTLLHSWIQEAWGESIDDLGRIQLLSSGNMFFPLEYIYDGPSPQFEAEVCPNAAEALRQAPARFRDTADALKKGHCGGCENEESAAYICPLHFWGFRKVIERHAKAHLNEQDRLHMPVPSRTPFGALGPGLFAASDRAFDFDSGPESKENLLASLTKLGAREPGTADNWTAWKELVKKSQPEAKLLVLLPHSDTVPIDVEVLELGQKDKLPKNLINTELVGKMETPQLLLLLGCSTADVTRSFAPYPKLFREAGADIIVAPLAPILGADAAPIAGQIADMLALRFAGGIETTLGEILRDIRCQLLAAGFPGVLGLLCFGDADWIFGGSRAAA